MEIKKTMKKIALASLLAFPAISGSRVHAQEKNDSPWRIRASISENALAAKYNKGFYEEINSEYGSNIRNWNLDHGWKDIKQDSIKQFGGMDVDIRTNKNVYLTAGYKRTLPLQSEYHERYSYDDPGYMQRALYDIEVKENLEMQCASLGLGYEVGWGRWLFDGKGKADYWIASSDYHVVRKQGLPGNPGASVQEKNGKYGGKAFGWTLEASVNRMIGKRYFAGIGASWTLMRMMAFGEESTKTNNVESKRNMGVDIDASGAMISAKIGIFLK